jgi:hypothetical protein
MMTIILDPYTLPAKGKVEVKLERSFEIKISAEEARRQVNHWLHHEVSYLIGAESPTLVIGEQAVVWRVPARLAFPDTGRVGTVGAVEVDVTSGAMNNTPVCKADIERCAEALAAKLPPYQPKTEVPAAFLPKHIPPAPKLVLNENGIPVVAATSKEETP